MLDTKGKKYYLVSGYYSESTIAGWARGNAVKLLGEEILLPNYEVGYEIDVTGNDDLDFPADKLVSNRPTLMNGKDVIGYIHQEHKDGIDRVIIYPNFR